MSGSGSTTFAILSKVDQAQAVEQKFRARFGRCWTAVLPI
jgi:4-diphosphocytidyl-2C-methyl-D-erythritol kinase